MGISGLSDLLRKKCGDVFVQSHLSNHQYKKFAIDISIYIFKYKTIFAEKWLASLITLIISLRRNEIHAVFIFDGKNAPVEKVKTQEDRKKQREKTENTVSTLEKDFKNYNLTEEISPFLLEYYNKKNKTVPSLLKPNVKHFDPDFIDFEIQKLKKQVVYKDNDEMDTVRDMFDILGVPWVIADGEAETLCSHLCLRGEVDAVLSEDSDVMAYQTPLFISKINIYRDTVIEVDFKKILEGLEISKEQFVDLCIMCGTDYNKNIPKVGPKTALNLIKEYGSIEGINENTTYSISILNHEKVRELFIARGDEEITIPYCTPCDFAKVSEFFFKNNISINMSIIEKAFSQRVLDFFSDGEDEE